MTHILAVVQVVTLGGVGVAVIVVAAVKVARLSGLPARWAPITATLLGIGIGAASWLSGVTDAATGLVAGFLAGAAAIGLNSGTKNTFRR